MEKDLVAYLRNYIGKETSFNTGAKVTTELDKFTTLIQKKSINLGYSVAAKSKLYVVYAGQDVTFTIPVVYSIVLKDGTEYLFNGFLL